MPYGDFSLHISLSYGYIERTHEPCVPTMRVFLPNSLFYFFSEGVCGNLGLLCLFGYLGGSVLEGMVIL